MRNDLHAIPEPWSYNPSKWSQRVFICLIAAVATVIALYMGLYQWKLIPSVWDPVFGSSSMQVLDSDLSHQITRWIGIPDAILGALAYLSDVIFALAGSTRRWQDRPWLVILFGIDVIPVGFVSALLVFMQGFVVHHFCFLCLVSACISLLLIALSYDEVLSSVIFLRRVWKRSKSGKFLWHTFWGRGSDLANIVGQEMVEQRQRRKRVCGRA
jgi:uncharacterized membrane protein